MNSNYIRNLFLAAILSMIFAPAIVNWIKDRTLEDHSFSQRLR